MPEYFVQVAFDLKRAHPSAYPDVKGLLQQVSLTKYVNDGHKLIILPSNTFAGFVRGQNAQEVIGGVEEAVFRRLYGRQGTCFITAALRDASEFDGGIFSSWKGIIR
jgi:hypothetical protein